MLYRKTRHSGRPVYALSQPTGSLYRVTTRSMLWAAGGVAAVALMSWRAPRASKVEGVKGGTNADPQQRDLTKII